MDQKTQKKEVIALVIGIDDYDSYTKLTNAVNDAKGIRDKFKSLGIDVLYQININDLESVKLIDQFLDKLKHYQLGLFYYAGHGVEFNGKNLLLLKNAPECEGVNSICHFSIDLQDLINQMNEKCKSNILIIDACRNNPGFRGTKIHTNILPLDVPTGTMIAYSTSPGQTAKDNGMTGHSMYTGALLEHLNEEGVEIEMLFKKVRGTVHALSNGEQTTWEHTSLLGRICLNQGTILDILSLGYTKEAICDKYYQDQLVDEFKSYNFTKQEFALDKFKKSTINDKNLNFVIGRNILQAAIGGCYACQNFIRNGQNELIKYSNIKGENPILDGILFEIYFNHEGKFRYSEFKSGFINELAELSNIKQLEKSFEFIEKALSKYQQYLLYSLSINEKTVNFELKLNNDFEITSLMSNNIELLTKNENNSRFSFPFSKEFTDIEELKRKLSYLYAIPFRNIFITCNFKEPNNFSLTKNYLKEKLIDI